MCFKYCFTEQNAVFSKYGVNWWWFALFGLLVHQLRWCGNLMIQSEIHQRKRQIHLKAKIMNVINVFNT